MNNRISYAQKIKEEIREVQISIYLYIVRVNKIFKEKEKEWKITHHSLFLVLCSGGGLTKKRTHDC